MPVVCVNLDIAADPAVVWQKVCNVADYPTFMDDVQSIEIIEDGPVRTTSWSVLLKGSVLEWTERETLDEAALRIEFTQIDGDLDRFDGHWLIRPRVGGSSVQLEVDFDIGIPLLADMLNPVAERALRENSERMLRGLDAEARREVA